MVSIFYLISRKKFLQVLVTACRPFIFPSHDVIAMCDDFSHKYVSSSFPCRVEKVGCVAANKSQRLTVNVSLALELSLALWLDFVNSSPLRPESW